MLPALSSALLLAGNVYHPASWVDPEPKLSLARCPHDSGCLPARTAGRNRIKDKMIVVTKQRMSNEGGSS